MISLCCSFYLLGLAASVQSSEQVRGDLPVLDTQQLMLIPAKHGVHLAGGEGVGLKYFRDQTLLHSFNLRYFQVFLVLSGLQIWLY